MKTIVLTGNRGPLRELAHVAVCVPSACTAHIQETHLAIEHIVCHVVERALYAQGTDDESADASRAA